LHAYMRRQIAGIYGNPTGLSKNGPIPGHLFGLTSRFLRDECHDHSVSVKFICKPSSVLESAKLLVVVENMNKII
ncbi:hypothetical protein ANCDUO_13694, partial [Ancylostoma duodenale]